MAAVNISLLAKAGGGLAVGALFSVYSVYFISPHVFDQYENVHIFAVSDNTNPLATEELVHQKDTKNFECEIKHETPKKVDCEIYEFKPFNKKQINSESLRQTQHIQNATKTKLAEEKNYFKITISNKSWDWTTDHGKKIYIIKKPTTNTATASNNQYASLTPKFAIFGNQNYKTKTNYFLAYHTGTEVLEKNTTELECTWKDKNDWKTCCVYDFSKNNEQNKSYWELEFQEFATANPVNSTKIETNRHYVIKLDEVDDTSTYSVQVKTKDTPEKTITLNRLVPVFYDEKLKQIFILERFYK